MTTRHFSELQLLALLDEELPRAEGAQARSHLTRCFSCYRLYEGLRRESDVLRAVVALDAPRERDVSLELGGVVAAGLVFSLGLLGFRYFFDGIAAAVAKTPMPDAPPSAFGTRFRPSLPVGRRAGRLSGCLRRDRHHDPSGCLSGVNCRPSSPRPHHATRAGGANCRTRAFSSPAEALDVVTGDGARCRIAPEQVVSDDLLLLCEKATVVGTLRGDLYFFGRSLTISGRVDGDVFGAANELNLDGSVGLSLRGVAQTVRIGGELGRGLAAVGRRIAILPGASVGGGVLAAVGRLSVAGPVRGSILATGGFLDLNAPIEGDLKFKGERLLLGSGAAIGGSANYTGPTEPEREPGAPTVKWAEPEPEEANVWGEVTGMATRWARGLVVGLVLVLFASGPLGMMAAIGGRPIAPLLLGLLLFVGLPFMSLLLALTLVGLPLALATGVLYLSLLYAGRVIAAMVIGQAILGFAATNVQRIVRIALGLAILVLAAEVPYLGAMVGLLVMFFGLGVFGLLVWRARPEAATR